MKFKNNLILTFGALLIGGVSFAQEQGNSNETFEAVNNTWQPSLVEDGVIDRVPHKNAVRPIHKVREIDVAWKTTVWRVIDVNQKQNMAFRYTGDAYTGGGAFIEILNDAIKRGKVRAFSALDDRFSSPMDEATFNNLLGSKETSMVIDPITGEETITETDKFFDVSSVTQYQIKEEWFFDRNRGRMIVQLVGIAPLQDKYDPNTNEYIASTPLYWIHYPDLRPYLVDYEVYNPRNDLNRISWADFLDGHHYSSYVIKTSLNNPYGDFLPYQNSPRGLAEGQKVLNQIIEREMNMWEE